MSRDHEGDRPRAEPVPKRPQMGEPTDIVNYVTLEAPAPLELRKLVLELLDEGWEPQGGVCVVNSSAGGATWWYFQAMILRES